MVKWQAAYGLIAILLRSCQPQLRNQRAPFFGFRREVLLMRLHGSRSHRNQVKVGNRLVHLWQLFLTINLLVAERQVKCFAARLRCIPRTVHIKFQRIAFDVADVDRPRVAVVDGRAIVAAGSGKPCLRAAQIAETGVKRDLVNG